MNTSWHSYPSIFSLGHKAVAELLKHSVVVEEKVDGSQFSFGYFPGAEYGDLQIRSKGAVMHIDAPEKMFTKAAETVKHLHSKGLLREGWTYRAEYLAKPQHNALAYNRTPLQHLIIFDINVGHEEYLPYDTKAVEAARLGLEVVPRLHEGLLTLDICRQLLNTDSVLGGQKIEGIVIKPERYDLYAPDKKVLLAKFVSEAFKEVHKRTWGESNPGGKDIIGQIAERYCTPARWNKAIQHLKEAGTIEGDKPQDIGAILKEIPADVLKECREDIERDLMKWAWPHISRAVTRGFPQWFKEQLMKQAFEQEEVAQ